jgi:tetratricopeptide (TPR) repeat protein
LGVPTVFGLKGIPVLLDLVDAW